MWVSVSMRAYFSVFPLHFEDVYYTCSPNIWELKTKRHALIFGTLLTSRDGLLWKLSIVKYRNTDGGRPPNTWSRHICDLHLCFTCWDQPFPQTCSDYPDSFKTVTCIYALLVGTSLFPKHVLIIRTHLRLWLAFMLYLLGPAFSQNMFWLSGLI